MRHRAVERDVGSLRQRRKCARVFPRRVEFIAGHGDQRHAQPLHGSQHLQDFGRLAAGRQRQHYVATHHHAQVAVHGFGGMQKQRGTASGGERGRDLARDQSALAHASDHDAAGATIQHFNRAIEVLAHGPGKPVSQSAQGCGFNANNIFANTFHEKLSRRIGARLGH